jgi:hypothetical protein
MRQPAPIDPTTALRSLIAALPEDRLRQLVLELLLTGLTAKAPIARARRKPPEPEVTPGRAKRGRKRSPAVVAKMKLAQQRRRDAEKKRAKRATAKGNGGGNGGAPAAAAKAATLAPAAGGNGVPPVRTDAADPRARRREADRARHAAAAADRASQRLVDDAAAAEQATAASLWTHAALLQPKAPWRAIVREFGINEAVAQDAHRTHKLPPGITGDAVTRFLELPAS